VSSSRFEKSTHHRKFADESGDVAEKLIEKAGHMVVARELVSDDAKMLGSSLDKALATEGVDVAIFTGGTGVAPRDITIEAIRPRFEKELEGFGELLRAVSYAKMGIPAVLTRATAGLVRGKLVLCLPGSPDGVETALALFMQDLPHVIYIARMRP
jgi:molybdopterin adenylyltransferase